MFTNFTKFGILVFPGIVSHIHGDIEDDMNTEQSASIVTVYDYYDHFTTMARYVSKQVVDRTDYWTDLLIIESSQST
jgi:hypothetical protein